MFCRRLAAGAIWLLLAAACSNAPTRSQPRAVEATTSEQHAIASATDESLPAVRDPGEIPEVICRYEKRRGGLTRHHVCLPKAAIQRRRQHATDFIRARQSGHEPGYLRVLKSY